LDGITIGDGAVVAAGSVVTKNVNPYSLVAGVPAIHKKFKFSNEKIKEIMTNPWWNKDFEDIKKMIIK
jgi:acetyltransferase-like isoleucine patch superfamily enzyme